MMAISAEDKLGKYFDWHELCPKSVPSDPKIVANLRMLCSRILDPLREAIRSPLIITSGYRSAEHNEAVGGAKHSYHVLGMAADVTCGYARWTPLEIAKVAGTISAVGGLGLYAPINRLGSFIHVDLRPRGRDGKITTWYHVDGKYTDLPADILAALKAAKVPV